MHKEKLQMLIPQELQLSRALSQRKRTNARLNVKTLML